MKVPWVCISDVVITDEGLLLCYVRRIDDYRGAGVIVIGAGVAYADAVVCIRALSGRHMGYIIGNIDITAYGIFTSGTDAGREHTASSLDSSARDGDVAALGRISSTMSFAATAISRDEAALNFDFATDKIISSSDAAAKVAAAGRECAIAIGSALEVSLLPEGTKMPG